jgi:hypothetical protein
MTWRLPFSSSNRETRFSLAPPPAFHSPAWRERGPRQGRKRVSSSFDATKIMRRFAPGGTTPSPGLRPPSPAKRGRGRLAFFSPNRETRFPFAPPPAFPSPARRGRVARQGRERASFPTERSDGNFSEKQNNAPHCLLSRPYRGTLSPEVSGARGTASDSASLASSTFSVKGHWCAGLRPAGEPEARVPPPLSSARVAAATMTVNCTPMEGKIGAIRLHLLIRSGDLS